MEIPGKCGNRIVSASCQRNWNLWTSCLCFHDNDVNDDKVYCAVFLPIYSMRWSRSSSSSGSNNNKNNSNKKLVRRHNIKSSRRLLVATTAVVVFVIVVVVAWYHVVETLRSTTTTIINTISSKKQENNYNAVINKSSSNNNTDTYCLKQHFYHGLWNFTTHSITIPNKQRDGPITSLELLQNIIHNTNQDDDKINDYINGKEGTMIPECFVPNISRTQELVDTISSATTTTLEQRSLFLGRPIMNVGLSKCGSSSLYHFFNCIDEKHNNDGGHSYKYQATHAREGSCIATAIQNGYLPISGCDQIPRDTNALLEMNIQEPKTKFKNRRSEQNQQQQQQQDHQCWYPQISFLDEIHEEYPTATFILMFRPIHDWIRSVYSWSDLVKRLTFCRYNIPGLIKRQPSGTTGISSSKLSYQELGYFYCIHVQHIRNFVQQYPSHNLIELDLYNTNQTSHFLTTLFDHNSISAATSTIRKKKTKMKKKEKMSSSSSSTSCWGKYNENTNLAKQIEEHKLKNQNRTTYM